jgi:hypothetical protein
VCARAYVCMCVCVCAPACVCLFISVLVSHTTVLPIGTALVQFCKVEDATKAVRELHGHTLAGHDRPLEVKYADLLFSVI